MHDIFGFSVVTAARFFRRGRRGLAIGWVTGLSVLGLGIGVAAMCVVFSVINGFEADLRQRLLSANPHVMLYRYPAGMRRPDVWAEMVKRQLGAQLTGVAPFVFYESLAAAGEQLKAVIVRGWNPEQRRAVQDSGPLVFPEAAWEALQEEITLTDAGGSLAVRPAAIVGVGLQRDLGLSVGGSLALISPQDQETLGHFRIVGTYDSGLKRYDDRLVILSLPSAQEFFGMAEVVTGLELGLAEPMQSRAVAAELKEAFGQLSVKDWQAFNSNLFEAIQKQRAAAALVVVLATVVGSFNVLTSLFVLVAQRQGEISLLKALGATHAQVMWLFLHQGLIIGVAGSVLGLAVGLGALQIIDTYRFIDLPDRYNLSTLNVSYEPLLFCGVIGIALAITLVASFVPARRAARVHPAVGLRS